MRIDETNLNEVFTYHPPQSEDTKQRYVNIRDGGKAFAATLLENVPQCAERTRALNMIVDAVAIANRAVALSEAGISGV